MDDRVYSDMGDGIIEGWFEPFKILAMPSENANFDENCRMMVGSEVRKIINMCYTQKSVSAVLVTKQQIERGRRIIEQGEGGRRLWKHITNGLFKCSRLSDAPKVVY